MTDSTQPDIPQENRAHIHIPLITDEDVREHGEKAPQIALTRALLEANEDLAAVYRNHEAAQDAVNVLSEECARLETQLASVTAERDQLRLFLQDCPQCALKDQQIVRLKAPVRDEEWAHKYDTYWTNRKEVDALISNRGK